jgi:hypothetical protein
MLKMNVLPNLPQLDRETEGWGKENNGDERQKIK